ncbi:MAG: polysulfide reductase NrfD [Ardenticatenaceae bacterium]|nr:polysulfide reductase NrfD [Ardenticatenaceae bacterium]
MTTDLSLTVTPKNYGFVIDNRKCIGCHACSTACKSENEVPLGVYRTWVKYVEQGAFPNTHRHFQVTRCNHCANPPCVRICPTEAMYQREDGIVEFDNRACIGCKACMQACPYDAIHIDPNTNTAAKCHYCAHRVEIGLEPACVVVCPEQAIIAGDMNDPNTQISQLLATQKVTVRKPEQGTSPKLFYINGNDVSLHPTATERFPETFMWADVVDGHGAGGGGEHKPKRAKTRQHTLSGAKLRAPQPQGEPWHGPIQIGGTMAEHMVQVGYNAQHKIPWHWPVPAYLVTKAISSGALMIFTLGAIFGWFSYDGLTAVATSLISVIFIALTTAFLVYDLERPERFLYILIRPQWRSWLARGAVFLISFSVVAGLWWLLEMGDHFGWINGGTATDIRPYLLLLGFPLAVGVATYTAFLFAQAEGRDMWQSPLLPFHLLLQAIMAGSSLTVLLSFTRLFSQEFAITAVIILFFTLILDLFLTLAGEFGVPHASEVAAKASHEIRYGRYKNHFWYGSILGGHVLPLALILLAVFLNTSIFVVVPAGLFTLIGLYLYEYAFVMAPQEIPNS